MTQFFKQTVAYVLIASMLGVVSPAVQAEVIGTLTAIESSQRTANIEKLNEVMARDQVREQLRALGVDEARLDARLAGLTNAELNQLAEQIDTLPAGAGVLEIVGITFVVLLILEAVGVIDIFKKFP